MDAHKKNKPSKVENVLMLFIDKKYRNRVLEKPLAWIVFALLSALVLLK